MCFQPVEGSAPWPTPDVSSRSLYRAWRDEKNAALTYAAAAANEKDARRRDIFLRMAAEEEKHAAALGGAAARARRGPGGIPGDRPRGAETPRAGGQDPVTIASTMAAAEGSADGAYEVLATLAPTEADRKAFVDGRAGRTRARPRAEGHGLRRRSIRGAPWTGSWDGNATSAPAGGSGRPSTGSTTAWVPRSAWSAGWPAPPT